MYVLSRHDHHQISIEHRRLTAWGFLFVRALRTETSGGSRGVLFSEPALSTSLQHVSIIPTAADVTDSSLYE